MLCEAVSMDLRRGSSFVARSVLTAVTVVSLAIFSAVDVSAEETETTDHAAELAQQVDGTSDGCIGTITASLSAESLPSGEWSAHGDCLVGENFYEFAEGPVLAKAAVADVVYADGHSGRIAAGVLTLGNGLGLGIVGVEDAATGVVKWSAVLDDFESEDDSVSVSGEGVAVFPIERATVSAQLTGTGTDVKPFLDDYEDPVSDVTDPDRTGAAPEPDEHQPSGSKAADDSDSSDRPGSAPSGAVDGETSGSGSVDADQFDDAGSGSSAGSSDASGALGTTDGGGAGTTDGQGTNASSSPGAGSSASRPAGDPVASGIDYGMIDAPRDAGQP